MKKMTMNGLLTFKKNTMITRFFLLLLFIAGTVAVQAQPVFQNYKTAVGSANSAVVAKPDNLQTGDLLILTIAFESGNGTTLGTPTSPAGSSWTQIIRHNQSGDVGVAAYWRVATNNEPATYSISTEGKKWSIGVSRVTNFNASTPIHISDGANNENSTIVAPSITTTIDNTLVFALFGTNKPGTATGVSDERYDVPNTSHGVPGHMVATYVKSAKGETLTKTATFTGGVDKWAAVQFAINPCSFSAGAIQTTGQFLSSSQTPSQIGSTTAASGGDGSITYSWRSSPDYGSAISGATSATYTPPAGVSATYRRYAKDGTCQSDPLASSGEWTVSICTTGQWIGVTSTDWFTASNWCGGTLPTDATDVVIPAGTQFQPAIGSTGSGNALSHNLTINANASLNFTATRTLELHGSLINNGTFSAPLGTVLVSGGNNHSIGGSSLVTFNNLHLNTQQNRTLSGPVQVNGLLTFTNGNLISTAQNLLTIGQNGTVTGASDNSLVEGPVKKIGVAAFTFPVGMQNPQNQNKYQYHPIKIEPTGSPVATDAYVAEYLRRNPGEYTIMSRPSGSSGREKYLGGVQVISQTEFWNLQRVSGSTKVHLTLYWHEYSGPQKDVYVQNHSSLTIARLYGMSSANANDMMWEVAGTGSPTRDVTKINEKSKPVQGSVTLPDFSAFNDTDPYTPSGSANLSSFNIGTFAANLGTPLVELGSESNGAMNSSSGTNLTIGSFDAAAMPVTLTSFNARLTPESKVSLSWATASESVNKGFRIERQASGSGMAGKFETIGFVFTKALHGNSQSSLFYNFMDEKPLKGTSFYRLVQEDLDGKLTNSEVRLINFMGSEAVVLLFPNPSNGDFTISRTPYGKSVGVEVYDISGRLIKRLGNTTATVIRFHIDQPGLYNLKLICGESGAQTIQRIVIK